MVGVKDGGSVVVVGLWVVILLCSSAIGGFSCFIGENVSPSYSIERH